MFYRLHYRHIDRLPAYFQLLAPSGLCARPVGVSADVGDIPRVVLLVQPATLERHMLHLHNTARKVVVQVQGNTAELGQVPDGKLQDVVCRVPVAVHDKFRQISVPESVAEDEVLITAATRPARRAVFQQRKHSLRVKVVLVVGLNAQRARIEAFDALARPHHVRDVHRLRLLLFIPGNDRYGALPRLALRRRGRDRAPALRQRRYDSFVVDRRHFRVAARPLLHYGVVRGRGQRKGVPDIQPFARLVQLDAVIVPYFLVDALLPVRGVRFKGFYKGRVLSQQFFRLFIGDALGRIKLRRAELRS